MADVSLAWHRTLTSSLDKLRSDNTLCDTTIATSDGQSLTTHACVLAAASPVLQTALVKIAERCYLVNIAGITCQVWRLVLHFVYTGTLDTDCTSNVEDISAAAATLQLPLLLQIVETKQEKKKRIGEGGGGDFEVTLGGSGDRVELAQFVKNEARSDDVEYQLEPAGEKGGTDAGLKASVAGSNDEDDSCVQHRGDRSSELDVGGEVETSEVTDGNNDTVTSVDTATVLVPASDRISSVQVKPSDGGTESTGIVTRTLRHECDICARRFRYRSALTIHARTHTEEKPYACVECGMKFGSRAVLKNHTYTHMTDRQIYQCDQCDKCFLTKSGLWQHRRSHRLRVGTAVTTCTICDKRLDSLDELREHLVTEHNRKMFACIECHKMFESEAALSAHTATHAGEKEFICNICGQSFDQFNALKCHQRLHAGQKRYSCEECGARFQTKCGYKAHMKRHSSSQEKFLCTCGKVYTTLRGLHNHRQHHHKDGESDKKPTCSICQSEFETSADLNEHKASEHRRRYLCGECGNTFSTPGALLRHTLIHTGEKPFACMTCGRAFRTRGTLVAHERCHTGEKPFPCPTCGARFRIRNALTIHKRIHTGERPYECAVCAARFRSRTLQMAHQQRHHVPASERKHVCSKCGKIFLSRSTLREHEQRNHADDPSVDEMRRCVCTLCGKVVAHAASLRSHMYVHVKKKLFQCIQCESAFRRNSDLKRHLRQVHGYEVVPDAATVTESPSESSHVICEPVLEQEHLSEATIAHVQRHTDKGKFPCPCGKVYSSRKSLQNHHVYKHQDGDVRCQIEEEEQEDQRKKAERKPAARRSRTKPKTRGQNLCAECGRTFSMPSALKLHSLVHADIKPFVCETCGHAFRVRSKLVTHERRHTGEKPFACVTCDRRFRLREVLKRHLLTHTGEKPFVCSVCNKSFTTKSQVMMHHQYQHVPYDERKRYACDRCDKTYLSRNELRDHGARFHGDSCVICSKCGKSFPCLRSLRCHMNVHMDTVPYRCIACRAGFKWKASLKRHLHKVHDIRVISKVHSDDATITTAQTFVEDIKHTVILTANLSGVTPANGNDIA